MSSFNQAPKDYCILFLDMDSFFASCEQQLQPELRGKPVGVVPQLVETTCVLSASYEAKRLGVKTGTGIREARALCPHMQFVEARPPTYKDIHYQIKAILEEVSPWVDAKSIDEFSVAMSPSEQNEAHTAQIAVYIKERLKSVIGSYITASIGFAPNQFLAKVASELHKPDAYFCITMENLEQTLASLELTDLPGIARGMSRRLRSIGIHTTKRLLNTNIPTLRRLFGFLGEVWWYRLHGYEVDDYATHRSSIGHSHVLPPHWRTYDRAYQVLQRLVHKAGQRLRREGYMATHTSLSVQYMGHGYFFDHYRSHPYQDTACAAAIAKRLFERQPSKLDPILHLAFTFGGLITMNARPVSLFVETEKVTRLSEALDVINDKFGRDTVSVGSMLAAKDTAPDRIPFGRLRY